MGRELRTDEATLTGVAHRMRESADLFERHTGELVDSVGGDRSPWGVGTLALVMDEINGRLADACRHLHGNLDRTATAVREMADRFGLAEDTNRRLTEDVSQRAR